MLVIAAFQAESPQLSIFAHLPTGASEYAAGTGDEGFIHPEQKTRLIEDAGATFLRAPHLLCNV